MRSGKFLIQLKFMRRIVRQQRLIRQFLRSGGALLRSSRGVLNNGGYLLNSIYNLSNCSGLFLRRLIPLLILAVVFSAIAFLPISRIIFQILGHHHSGIRCQAIDRNAMFTIASKILLISMDEPGIFCIERCETFNK